MALRRAPSAGLPSKLKTASAERERGSEAASSHAASDHSASDHQKHSSSQARLKLSLFKLLSKPRYSQVKFLLLSCCRPPSEHRSSVCESGPPLVEIGQAKPWLTVDLKHARSHAIRICAIKNPGSRSYRTSGESAWLEPPIFPMPTS